MTDKEDPHQASAGNDGARALLSDTDLFASAAPELIERVLRTGYSKRVGRNETLFRQGEPAEVFYLIISGTVRISVDSPDGQTLNLRTFSQGDVMGEIAVIDQGVRTATAVMQEPGIVFCLGHNHLRALITENAEFSYQVMRLLCRRVRWTNAQLEDSTFLESESRVAKCLLALRDSQNRVQTSQAELARYVTLSRQSLNGVLQKFQQQQWIHLAHKNIEILSVSALTASLEAT